MLKIVQALFAISILFWGVSHSPAVAQNGRFIGELEMQMIGNSDRDAKLLKQFGFIDPGGRNWSVPAGAIVNGASIPWQLWSIVGSPWTGKYRRASVVHDYYCETKDRGWRNVHRVFYDAMIADGVGVRQAKLMYGAVMYFGPKWKIEYGVDGKPHLQTWQPEFSRERFDQLEKWIDASNPSLEQIDALVQ